MTTNPERTKCGAVITLLSCNEVRTFRLAGLLLHMVLASKFQCRFHSFASAADEERSHEFAPRTLRKQLGQILGGGCTVEQGMTVRDLVHLI